MGHHCGTSTRSSGTVVWLRHGAGAVHAFPSLTTNPPSDLASVSTCSLRRIKTGERWTEDMRGARCERCCRRLGVRCTGALRAL